LAPPAPPSTSAPSTSVAPPLARRDEPADGGSPSLRTTGFILGALGIAALAAGGAVDLVALSKANDADSKAQSANMNAVRYPDSTYKSAMDEHADAVRLQVVAIALAATGAVALGTGVTL